MSEEPVVMICLPVAEVPEPVDGSIEQWCSVCAVAVWLSPSSKEILDAHSAEGTAHSLVCVDCAPGMMEAVKGELQPPSAKQTLEMYQWIREHGM